MHLYDRSMVTNTNLKYGYSSSNYYVIMMLQNLEKKNRKFPIFSHSRGTKCRVVVCARYVVKRPSKRSVLVPLLIASCEAVSFNEFCYSNVSGYIYPNYDQNEFVSLTSSSINS